MKTIIAIIISIVTAIVANAQLVNIAAPEQNSVYEGPSNIRGFVAGKKYLA